MREDSGRLRPFLLAVLILPGAGRGAEPAPFPVDAEQVAVRVARNQRLAERRWGGATYDLVEVRTTYDRSGRPKEISRRLYYVLAEENGGEASRDLIEVNGRPPTPAEIREVAEEDTKRHKRIEERAARRAAAPSPVEGDEDDPIVDGKRLSDILSRYELRFLAEDIFEGRPVYLLEFVSRPGIPTRTIADRALASMTGRVVIDAADFQIHSLEAHLTENLKVAGGLAANVKDAGISYRSVRLGPDLFFPCTVDVHVIGKKALFFSLNTTFRFEYSNLKSFRVDAEAVVGAAPDSPPGRPPGASRP